MQYLMFNMCTALSYIPGRDDVQAGLLFMQYYFYIIMKSASQLRIATYNIVQC